MPQQSTSPNASFGAERSLLTQHQTQQAREADASISISCSTDSELDRAFLSSPASQLVIEALHQGCSLRQAAFRASVPVNTARKVLAVLPKTADV